VTNTGRRDRYSIKLICQPCWVLGHAEVSEDADPNRREPDFRVEYCPATFHVIRETRTRATTRIACAACGELVHGY
jgi:hypothetical protein